MNRAIVKIETNYAMYASAGEFLRFSESGAIYQIAGIRGRRMRIFPWRPSPLPRRLP